MSAAQIAGLNRGRAKLAAYQAAKKEFHSGVSDSTPSALRDQPNNSDWAKRGQSTILDRAE
jgi:hypothetical protein